MATIVADRVRSKSMAFVCRALDVKFLLTIESFQCNPTLRKVVG